MHFLAERFLLLRRIDTFEVKDELAFAKTMKQDMAEIAQYGYSWRIVSKNYFALVRHSLMVSKSLKFTLIHASIKLL